MDILHSIRGALLEAQDILNQFIQNPENIATIAETAEMMRDVFEQEGRIFTCGNGGSLCDAVHFAEECTGKFRSDRKPLPAIALGDVDISPVRRTISDLRRSSRVRSQHSDTPATYSSSFQPAETLKMLCVLRWRRNHGGCRCLGCSVGMVETLSNTAIFV